MEKVLTIFIISIITTFSTYGQSYENWESKSIEEFYEKVPMKNGTLGEDGKKTSFVFVPTKIKQGTYEVTIIDYKNLLHYSNNRPLAQEELHKIHLEIVACKTILDGKK
jgi:hypothetical protein